MTDSPKRIFVDPDALPDAPAKRPVPLPEDAAHYVRDVLRLERGQSLEVLDGTGRIIRGQIQSIGQTGVKIAPRADEVTDRGESHCAITLYQAIPKGDRWRMVLEKTTELGVRRIVPLETERTVVDIPAERVDSKMNRWERIVGSATRQCGRSRTPNISPPSTLDDAIERPADSEAEYLLATRSEANDADSLGDALAAGPAAGGTSADAPSIAIWIGPEGGFTPDEYQRLQQSGVQPVRFGPRILRSESAGIAAVTAAQLICGDL